MATGEKLRISRRPGKRRKLKRDLAEHYEQAFRALLGGVTPAPLPVDLPPGVTLKSTRLKRRPRTSAAEKERDALLQRHARSLLEAAADYFRAENEVRMCVRCRKHQVRLAAQTARLHHLLQKILGDEAPRVRATIL